MDNQETETKEVSGSLEWAPDASITLSGVELESLVKLTELYTVPIYQLSPAQLTQYYGRANIAVRDILLRMKEDGTAKEVPTQI